MKIGENIYADSPPVTLGAGDPRMMKKFVRRLREEFQQIHPFVEIKFDWGFACGRSHVWYKLSPREREGKTEEDERRIFYHVYGIVKYLMKEFEPFRKYDSANPGNYIQFLRIYEWGYEPPI